MVPRNIIHMDLDAFFVAVECKLHNGLRNRPLIIGGSSRRGVVAACSYEARKFGVHSAMPMYLALQLCPDAKVISGDMEAYSKHSHLVTEIIADAAPAFEKASIDEFYIDASGMDRYFGAFKWAVELRKKVIKDSGLPISMGMSVNKLVSKVATGEFKPNAEKHIPAGEEKDFLAPLPVGKIPMIGKQTASFLYDMGVRKVATLREMPLKFLVSAFGKNGISLWNKAHGVDNSPIVSYSEQKSISTESTFDQDSIDVKGIKSILIAMIEKVAFTLREQKKLTSCVTVKIRYANFDTETKQVHIPYTSSDHVLLRVVLELFERLYNRRMLIRLVGVRLSSLVHGNHQISLFDDTEESISLYEAMDRMKHKHGVDKLVRATTLNVNKRVRMEMNAFKG
ncbi:MAG: DNA polymerase IV [Cyclobacteriaceae bacterium]|nr:DNA polymerase IV [Cyclobacteriaceae bacterium]MCB0499043.1 DNA polymerase IV [Cyclobacteriaceae bacterium]MCB9238319.1 DNA polymerase IV [Flammeovirgaceae bacterium]MCW5902963.1 DNA polymerase IV [Cyclobacteriaceae bacterium]